MTWGRFLDTQQALDRFLSGVERRAFRMAHIATGNREDALELVQDAMFKLVDKYHKRPEQEWGPLFHRILQSRIKDWYRRHAVQTKWLGWFRGGSDDDECLHQTAPDLHRPTLQVSAEHEEAIDRLGVALRQLPLRQQQAFLLRCWEGLSVEDTADAMGCSSGSVKTHYSRALATLRDRLEGYWP